jgi:two-component system sensor histidine kinase DesK
MEHTLEKSTHTCPPEPRTEGSQVWNYIWLAYSGFYFIEPVLRRNTLYWVETLCVYAVFLAIYLSLNKARSKRSQWILVASLFLLGILDIPRNQGASSFFIYVAAFIPFFVSSVFWVISLVLFDAAALFAEGLWLVYHPALRGNIDNTINLGISVFFVLVVGASNLVVAQQRRADRKLRQAEQEIVQLASVAERERIARDLHDVLGHTLSVIVLKAELAGRLIERDPQRALAEIGDVERTARTALAEVREAIGGYRSQGLAAEVDNARKALDAAGVALTLEEIDAAPALTPELQTVLSLTLREAVTNIVRHAHATHCRISFTTASGYHALSIEDDGKHPAPREGNGLRGMRERIQRLGGRFLLDTHEGTKLRIEIPTSSTTGATA